MGTGEDPRGPDAAVGLERGSNPEVTAAVLPQPATPGDAPAGDSGLERMRGRELSPAELVARRRNRRWMLGIALPAAVLGGMTLAASVLAGTGGAGVKPADVPPGFKAVSDGVFAYSIPSTWTQSPLYTDDVGDLGDVGADGWAAEHLDALTSAPVLGESPPKVFLYFGESRAVRYELRGGTRAVVPGASVAYRYELVRPGGFSATALDAWDASDDAQLWLLVRAGPSTTSEILASLRA